MARCFRWPAKVNICGLRVHLPWDTNQCSLLFLSNAANDSEAGGVTNNLQLAHDATVLAGDEVAVRSNKEGKFEAVGGSPPDDTVRVNNKNASNDEECQQ